MSSQTMTAPAVGHRPPDPGTDTPMYDYGGSQNHPSPPTDVRSDSAIRDMHNSAPASRPLPATQIGIKTEQSDNHDLIMGDAQKDSNAQSAAGALLAQLLGNQPTSTSASAPEQSAGQQMEHQDLKLHISNRPSIDQTAESSKFFDSDLPQDQDSAFTIQGMQNISNGGFSTTDIFAGIGTTPQEGGSAGHRLSDAMDTLSDPLNPKSSIDQPSLLPPFDIGGIPKNAFEALQQNELLTAAYLSQGADLSALGYQDGTTSVAGSEPRIQAFAKLEFDDGHFYVNTYSFILGRDVRAARAAHQREVQFRQAVRSSRAKSSSGGNTSHTPNRMKREESAAMMGSVVSDRGGIMGFDPDVPPHLPTNLNISRRSSKSSLDESAMPIHANPAQLQTTTSTDYNALAMQSLQEGNGEAKPVDTLALLPSPDSCPTIPIHPPSTIDGTAAGHRGISRRHVRIAYNFDRSFFEMEVMGRNGAFIGADWLSPGQVRPLHSGDYIQIGGVRIRFLLPDVPIGETGADRLEEEAAEDDDDPDSIDAEHEIDDMDRHMSDSVEGKESRVTKIVLKNKDADSSALPSIEGSGDQPARRRGPGRPPKDGIMSKRERAELAREQKMAAKREANGGVTPPPMAAIPVQNRPTKAGKTITKESVGAESPTSSVKPAEKRKYNKRKKDGTSMDYPLPSTEGGHLPTEPRPEEYVKPPPVKKRKPSRSPSPNYPPESAYTPEDLAKPPYNYAVLIFDALTDAGTPMTLKQIYRALKLKYPYFRFKCETEGWTSSVRHNLNGNGHLFMHAERDGKGWSWQLRPGASVEKEKKRRPSPPPPPPAQPPQVSAPAPQPYMGPISHSYAPPSGGPPPMQAQHHNFQFPPMPSTNFSAPPAAPQHSSPYVPPAPAVSSAPPKPPVPTPAPAPVPAPAPASFPIPSTIRSNLPAAFAQTIPSTYTSPYASDPTPQAAQGRPSQAPRPAQGPPPPQQQSPYPPPKPPSQQTPRMNPQPQAFPPAGPQFQPQHQQLAQSQQPQQQPHQPHQHPHPHQHQHAPQHAPQHVAPPHHQVQQQQHPIQQQHQHQHQHPPPPPPGPPMHSQVQSMPPRQNPLPPGPPESSSFNDRANKAIDDFEAVLMEDYEDKNYIREVLRSARARVLGNATESSFPGGEPKDEGVIMDVLRNLVGSLKDE
ncbi:Winged helix-turn-helix transcription repressor DNA-binding [Penicillium herquei]|nr:Winged helix-turn-helix transcription repressor DNA-binding [Penicillium herquei]